MQLKIVELPEKSLRQKSKAIKKIDKRIKKLIADMWETLEGQRDPEGVGLAAPQVGKNLRLFIFTFEDMQRTIINPKVIHKSKEVAKYKKNKEPLEGCLSYPHYYGPIARAKKIKIEYLNKNGEKVTEEFIGFPAQIIQHELDHLNGVLFVDHILKQKAPFYYVRGDEWEEVELV